MIIRRNLLTAVAISCCLHGCTKPEAGSQPPPEEPAASFPLAQTEPQPPSTSPQPQDTHEILLPPELRHELAKGALEDALERLDRGGWQSGLQLLWRAYETAALEDWVRESARNLLAGWGSDHPLVIRAGTCADISPDGRHALIRRGDAESESDPLQVFDVQTGRPVGRPFGDARFAFYSPNGKLVLTAKHHPRLVPALKLFNPATGRLHAELGLWTEATVHPTVRFSRDGALVALAGPVPPRLYDTDSGKLLSAPTRWETWNLNKMFVKVSPTLNYVAMEAGAYTCLYDPRQPLPGSGEMERPVAPVARLMTDADDVAFSPDGETLASVDGQGSVRFWDLASRTEHGAAIPPIRPRDGHTKTRRLIAFSPYSKVIAVTDPHGFVDVFDAEERTLLSMIAPRGACEQIFFGKSKGTLWIRSSKGKLTGWVRRSNEPIFAAWGLDDPVLKDFFVTPDCSHVIASAGGETYIWDLSRRLHPRFAPLSEAGLPDRWNGIGAEPYIPVVEQDSLRLVHLRSGKMHGEIMHFEEEIRHVAVSPGSDTVAVVLKSGAARLHRAESGGRIADLEGGVELEEGPFGNRLSITKDCRRVFGYGSENQFGFWDAETGRRTAIPLNARGNLLTLSADGKHLLLISEFQGNTRIAFHAPDTGGHNQTAELEGSFCGLRVDLTGRILAATSIKGRTIVIWDVAAEDELARIAGEVLANSTVSISRDGSRIAIVRKGGLHLHDVMTGYPLTRPISPFWRLSQGSPFTPYRAELADSDTLVTETSNQVTVWDLPRLPVDEKHLQAWVEQRVGATWTDGQWQRMTPEQWLDRQRVPEQ